MAECSDKSVDSLSSLLEKKLSLDHEDIKEKLNEMECPFSWQIPFDGHSKDSADVLRRTEMKWEELADEDEELASWKAFVLNITLCHQYTVKAGFPPPPLTAFEKLEECESAVGEAKSPTFFSIEGINHILQATRAFMLFYSKKYEEAEGLLKNITRPENMKKKSLATVYGAHAGILIEYGYAGLKESINFIERAIKLEPDCPQWLYLLGRALGRQRRIDSRTSIPDKREVEALEKACSLAPCKTFKTLLAQSYRETSRAVFFNPNCSRNTFKSYCDTLNRKSLDMYMKLMEEAEGNVHLNVRIAQGFLKLPKHYIKFDLAKKCIDRALEASPENTYANHVAGTYHSMTGNVNKAIKHFRISAETGNYGAWMDLVTIQVKNQPNYDPLPDLEKMYERFKTVDTYKEESLCHLGAHFYFKRSDFKKALGYWLKVIESNIHSKKLQVFSSRLVNNGVPVNINKIILDKIRAQISRGNLTKEEDELYKKLVAQYSDHPKLIKDVE